MAVSRCTWGVLWVAVAAVVVVATPPNDDCCAEITKNTEEAQKCSKTKYAWNEMNSCFGSTGPDCAGISFLNHPVLRALLPKQSTPVIAVVPGSPADKPLGKGVVSVGAIAHDLCCHAHPYGFFCNYESRPFTSIAKSSQNHCACANEWRKAVFNLVRGRVWPVVFHMPIEKYIRRSQKDVEQPTDPNQKWGFIPDAEFTTDLTDLRPTRLPLSLGSYQPQASSQGLKEIASTRLLTAPPGTFLDCPAEDAACKLTCSWGTCKLANGTRLPKTACTCAGMVKVTFTFPNGYVAGDSNFCYSQKFSHIQVGGILWKSRYGVCANPTSGGQDPELVCTGKDSICTDNDAVCTWIRDARKNTACGAGRKQQVEAALAQSTTSCLGSCQASGDACKTGNGALKQLDCPAQQVCCPLSSSAADLETRLQSDELSPVKVNPDSPHISQTTLLQMYEEEVALLPEIHRRVEEHLMQRIQSF